MNKFSRPNHKNNGVAGLHYHQKRSHNQDSYDERITALVRFLARRAAEEDIRMYQEALQPPDNIQGG